MEYCFPKFNSLDQSYSTPMARTSQKKKLLDRNAVLNTMISLDFQSLFYFFHKYMLKIGEQHFLAILSLQLLHFYTLICLDIISKLYILNKTLFLCKHFLRSINMGSDYVGIVFLRHGVEASFLHMEVLSHPHYASEACLTLEIFHSFTVGRFKKKTYFDDSRNFKTTSCKNWNHLGKTDLTNVYCIVQRNKTGKYCPWVFCVGQCNWLT